MDKFTDLEFSLENITMIIYYFIEYFIVWALTYIFLLLQADFIRAYHKYRGIQ